MNGNGTRHVVIAMALTAIVMIIAGPQWNKKGGALNVKTYKSVGVAQK